MQGKQQIVAYFVRHGQCEANAEGRFRGTKTDYPLSAQGHHEAQELADYFSHIKLGDAWTSSKQRAEQTAETVLEPLGKVASPTEGLHPLDVGYLSGEKKANHTDDIKYFQEHPQTEIPGGQSIQEFRNKVKPHILLPIRRGIENGVPSITFSHSSIIHEVGNLIHGDHGAALVKPGGVAAVTYDGKYFRAHAVFKPAPKRDKQSIMT